VNSTVDLVFYALAEAWCPAGTDQINMCIIIIIIIIVIIIIL